MKIRLITLTVGLLPFNIAHLRAEEIAFISSQYLPQQSSQTVAYEASTGENFNAQESVNTEAAPLHLQLQRTLNSSQTRLLADNSTLEKNISEKTSNRNKSNLSTQPPSVSIKLRMSKGLANFDTLDQTEPLTSQTNDAPDDIVDPNAIVIEGDRLKVYQDREYTTTGNAVLRKSEQSIYGDSISYNVENEQMRVVGNSRIEGKESLISGSELNMKLADSVGEMKDASFLMNKPLMSSRRSNTANTTLYNDIAENNQSLSNQNIDDNTLAIQPSNETTQSRGDAEAIFFEGENKKRLKNARFTTCEVGNEDWYIKASNLKLDDYTKIGSATNARIDFKNVPILYTPWIRFPFSNERKSGFLAPTFGTTSKSGFELLTPYYWNISPDMDATLATRYLSRRGLQLQGEFRYLNENYSGIDNIEYLDKDDETDKTRYYMRFRHQQILGNGFSFNYDYSKVSDSQYFSDMTSRIISTSIVNLPQQANLNYTSDTWNFNGLIQKFQTLDGTSFPYERLPQLTLNGNKDWGLFNADIKNQFVRFDVNDSAPQSQTLVKGSRFTTYPSISLPYAVPFGYITPKIGVSYTNYNLDNIGTTGFEPTVNRTLPIVSLDSGIFFDRKVQIGKNSYTQTLEPRLFYVYIPYKDQSNLPVFDTAEADLNLGTLFLENQFVGGDRINNANQLSLAVTTRMFDAKTGVQRLAATLGQRFYFEDQKVGLPGDTLRTSSSSDIVAAATLRLRNHWSLDSAGQYSTSGGEIVKANFGTRYNPEPGKVLNLSYRFTKDLLEQVNISGQWPLGKGYYGVGRWNYSLQEKQPIEVLAGIEYDASCWKSRAVMQRISTATADANYALFFQLELGGLASVGSNPLTLLNREIPGYSKTIPDAYRQENRE